MKKFHFSKLIVLTAAFAFMLTGCSNPNNNSSAAQASQPASNPPKVSNSVSASESAETSEPAQAATSVEVTDIHGTVTVPVNPQKVVSLDNRTFETLSDWGVELVAVPKGVMPQNSPYYTDDAVQDVGDHREPNLEIIAAADPELVIVGQRFVNFYDEIKALVPNAAVVDFSFQLSDEKGKSGDSLVNGLKDSTTALGKIFDKNDEAQQLNTAFDKSIQDAKDAYNGTDTIMSVVVSGGEIGFSAPYSGRVWGPMYDVFGWVSALEVENASSDHKGDDISVEAIAQSNPDWIMVLDRDATFSSIEDKKPAKDVINDSPALKNTTAITNDQIIYAPDDTYTNESIQTYLELFENIASTLSK